MSMILDVAVPGDGTYTQEIDWFGPIDYAVLQSKLVYGSGGTSIKVFLQTSFDNGLTWRDVASQAFLVASLTRISAVKHGIASAANLVASDGVLADDTIVDGLFGTRFRVKYIVAGTYVASTLRIDAEARKSAGRYA